MPSAAWTSAPLATLIPPHLGKARVIVSQITPENNEYADGPTYLLWATQNKPAAARVRCNQFVNLLLTETYGWNLYQKFGSSSPDTVKWFGLISTSPSILPVTKINTLMPGDVLVSKYLNPGDGPKGHLMLVNSRPIKLTNYAPLVSQTEQYLVSILDSTSAPHGLDTRGAGQTGIGRGVIRLYVKNGLIVGWTWSDSNYSTYHDATTRPIVAGRLKL